VAHACIPSYWVGRGQEDRGSKPAWANSLQDYLKLKKKGLLSSSNGRTAALANVKIRVQTSVLQKIK
jgi:hypothetical protein